jgi:hypothetical protein
MTRLRPDGLSLASCGSWPGTSRPTTCRRLRSRRHVVGRDVPGQLPQVLAGLGHLGGLGRVGEPRRRDEGAGGEVEAGAVGEGVQHHATDQQRRGPFRLVGVGDDLRGVEDRHRSLAHHPEDLVAVDLLHDGGGVLVDPDPQQRGRLADDHEQPAVAVALFEVLVHHARLEEPEAGCS